MFLNKILINFKMTKNNDLGIFNCGKTLKSAYLESVNIN